MIEHGKVRELGTHDDLMTKPNGLYRRLQQMQNLDAASHGLSARDDLVKSVDAAEISNTPLLESSPDDVDPSKEDVSKNSRRAWLIGRENISCTMTLLVLRSLL